MVTGLARGHRESDAFDPTETWDEAVVNLAGLPGK